MPKYKKITEGVIDSFIGAVFNIVGKGTHSAALTGIAKKDPEIAKKVQMIQKNRKELKQMLNNTIKEVIFALSTTMEGDTTNYYLFRRLKDSGIKISSIARGISVGDELEYTDELTLSTAIASRMPYENSLAK